MSKPKRTIQTERLSASLKRITQPGSTHESSHGELSTASLETLLDQPIALFADVSKIPRLKRFRFQLLHHWLVSRFAPCRAADVGGGKGLLCYLLQQSGWQVTIIDPAPQALPGKYKDIATNSRVKIKEETEVSYLQTAFTPELAQNFDLLIAMHAHGCNVNIIDAAAQYGCGFAIFPCCVIDEPFYPPLGVHWLESLADYAVQKGLAVQTVRLNFKGQNIGLYTPGRCKLI